MTAVQNHIKPRTAGDLIHEKRADFVVGNDAAAGRTRYVVIQRAKTRIKAGRFIAVCITHERPVAGEMEYGFIACDHPRDEGGHSREDILAGGRDR
jgi:hypothetical protein